MSRDSSLREALISSSDDWELDPEPEPSPGCCSAMCGFFFPPPRTIRRTPKPFVQAQHTTTLPPSPEVSRAHVAAPLEPIVRETPWLSVFNARPSVEGSMYSVQPHPPHSSNTSSDTQEVRISQRSERCSAEAIEAGTMSEPDQGSSQRASSRSQSSRAPPSQQKPSPDTAETEQPAAGETFASPAVLPVLSKQAPTTRHPPVPVLATPESQVPSLGAPIAQVPKPQFNPHLETPQQEERAVEDVRAFLEATEKERPPVSVLSQKPAASQKPQIPALPIAQLPEPQFNPNLETPRQEERADEDVRKFLEATEKLAVQQQHTTVHDQPDAELARPVECGESSSDESADSGAIDI
eukprot:TRINITY_DN3777_c0_g1_i2.p1 TRINITY_DN3777_c0_g1~~TRINITY_DN3777_c0_g1_i2.p1  ORF type:complete len:353 (-),score=42.38 TRINITY_DN3777_c0_g1_i2:229-1287(-)